MQVFGLPGHVGCHGRTAAQAAAAVGVPPVPLLRRRPEGRRFRLTMSQRYAPPAKGRKPTKPGGFVQIDTLFVNVRPDAASARNAAALLDKLLAEAPLPVAWASSCSPAARSRCCARFSIWPAPTGASRTSRAGSWTPSSTKTVAAPAPTMRPSTSPKPTRKKGAIRGKLERPERDDDFLAKRILQMR